MSDLGSITERIALVIEAQKTWGEQAARELAEQLGVKIPETAQAAPAPRGAQREWPRLMLRLPPDLKNWITAKATASGASQNSEIIRVIRSAMRSEATV